MMNERHASNAFRKFSQPHVGQLLGNEHLKFRNVLANIRHVRTPEKIRSFHRLVVDCSENAMESKPSKVSMSGSMRYGDIC